MATVWWLSLHTPGRLCVWSRLAQILVVRIIIRPFDNHGMHVLSSPWTSSSSEAKAEYPEKLASQSASIIIPLVKGSGMDFSMQSARLIFHGVFTVSFFEAYSSLYLFCFILQGQWLICEVLEAGFLRSLLVLFMRSCHTLLQPLPRKIFGHILQPRSTGAFFIPAQTGATRIL